MNFAKEVALTIGKALLETTLRIVCGFAMVVVFVWFVGLAAGCATPTPSEDSALGQAHNSTFIIEISPNIHCSATAIGPHALLTATHCFPDPKASLSIAGRPVQIKRFVDDGADHRIVFIDMQFVSFAKLGELPQPGERVFIFGNPGDLVDMYRSGAVMGHVISEGQPFWILDMNIFFGDSGSAVFDQHGRIIGAVSQMIIEPSDSGVYAKYGAMRPFAFNPGDWGQAAAY